MENIHMKNVTFLVYKLLWQNTIETGTSCAFLVLEGLCGFFFLVCLFQDTVLHIKITRIPGLEDHTVASLPSLPQGVFHSFIYRSQATCQWDDNNWQPSQSGQPFPTKNSYSSDLIRGIHFHLIPVSQSVTQQSDWITAADITSLFSTANIVT